MRDLCKGIRALDPFVCCRQEKAKQLLGLQSELKLLEADIKQVISRKIINGPNQAAQPQQAQLIAAALTSAISQPEAHMPAALLPQSQPAMQHNKLQGQGLQLHSAAAQQPAAALSTSAATVAAEATEPGLCQAALPPPSAHVQLHSPAEDVAQQQLATSQRLVSHSTGQLPGQSPMPLSLEPSMSRASNGYLMITNAAPALQQGQIGQGRAGPLPVATAAPSSAAQASAPLPSHLEANGSMHIHPRHLAFQHFHQQQAALQHRQQQPGNGNLASAMSMDSADGDRMERAASLASAQSDAIRFEPLSGLLWGSAVVHSDCYVEIPLLNAPAHCP